ncbi:MAG: ComF family protein [Minicystis sp.]
MHLIASLLRTLAHLFLQQLGDALAPPCCAACDARLPRRAVFCAACAQTLAPCAAAEDAPLAFGAFGGALATTVRRFKYGARPDLARPLGALLRRAAEDAGLAVDLIVPVPLHPHRLAERGYNQAALLAAQLAQSLGARLGPRALARVRNTPPQAQLDRARRLGNVVEAFRLRTPLQVRGRRVLLIDDVATTGATLAACRAALLEGGARSVTALVIARAEREGDAP